MDWKSGETAPKNGKPFWGWLYDEGIHLMRWVRAEENSTIDGDQGGFVKVVDEQDGDWTVKFWLAWDTIPAPPGVGYDATHSRWRDGSPRLHMEEDESGDVEQLLKEQGATEGVKFDEDTGRPMRTFTIDLTK